MKSETEGRISDDCVKRWQFSVRGLVFLTTVVSLLLLMAVQVPLLLLFVVFLTGPLAMFFAWKPIGEGRSTWFLVGALVVGMSMMAGLSMIHDAGIMLLWSFVAIYLIGAAVCYRLTMQVR